MTENRTFIDVTKEWTDQARRGLARIPEYPPFAAAVETTKADMTLVLEAVMAGRISIGTLAELLSIKLVEADELALLDPLTGLYGRRGYERRLDEELAEASRVNEPVSLAVIDLDHFGDLNNTYGHPLGDDFLQTFAEELQSRMRESDIACRLGGDEFVIIMQHTDISGAATLFEKLINGSPATRTEPEIPPLMQTVTSRFNERHGLSITSTMSAGISSTSIANYSRNNLYNSADRALYAVKGAGRDGYAIARQPIKQQRRIY